MQAPTLGLLVIKGKLGMSDIADNGFNQIKFYLDKSNLAYQEKPETGCKRLDIQSGKHKCTVKVFNTGTIQVQGAESELKTNLMNVKQTIENGNSVSEILPFDIEKFPELLEEKIPAIDPIIVRFVSEAILSLKAGSCLGCAFLLGGASEKAFLLLVNTYTDAISDEEMKNKFKQRTSGKFIAKIYDEFKNSWKSSLNKPENLGWTNDLEIKIEQIFQFCRICRNEAGHPHLPPNLDKGVLLANMGQFVKYVEDLYKLIDFYKNNTVQFKPD